MTKSCPECGHSPLNFEVFVIDGYWSCPECDWIREDHDFPAGIDSDDD